MADNRDRSYVEGVMERLHPNGQRFKLHGADDYWQLSRWPDRDTAIPPIGTAVRLGIDPTGFVRSIEDVSAPAVVNGPLNAILPGSSPEVASGGPLDHRSHFLRATALQCAIAAAAAWRVEAAPEVIIANAETYLSWLALRGAHTPEENADRG